MLTPSRRCPKSVHQENQEPPSWLIPAAAIPPGKSIAWLRAKAQGSTPLQWRVLCCRWQAENEHHQGPDAEPTSDLNESTIDLEDDSVIGEEALRSETQPKLVRTSQDITRTNSVRIGTCRPTADDTRSTTHTKGAFDAEH